ncbi:MAG TPA: bifunctional serine/threonine-protein kinase/formylglycine-generating enzyme family protein [Anaerolineales bacterium]|nr:bifunctional serine/threonine-protein kinase/formylglycine-generating enzyme family protein [Anaerolineales bacterium]HMZ43632.1 bifunctional serine/threonine-protein kinase/formylglycine-generating enzyme family protein [Anaerolineales bacterium]HNA54948.1 bifunctional serine/threonine-protein kinase/formylglycine-generating enzyme family protein [Anaerolineales bacterium]HNC89775.1 bifunctional serine/threonine-protein kinase/formylglycine-generating enzyme family protein [Anaerolineales ba
MENFIGKHIDRYNIIDLLGQGGMATVYRAYDTRLEREVALKVIRHEAFPPDVLQNELKRFEREAKSLARLSHPNIVKVLDYGEYEGSPFLVMEYLPGGTLKQKIGSPIAWQDAMHLLLPVARGVEYAHNREIIHRDIKPSNILLAENETPTLSDFGIAKLFQNEGTLLTASGMAMGTPEYMAPEQWTGKTVPQSDMYALGVVLYEMVTGRRPYTADTPGGVFMMQVTEPVLFPRDIVPHLPEAVEQFLLKALSREPSNRHASMTEFIRDMELLLSNAETKVPINRMETLKGSPGQSSVRKDASSPSRKLVPFNWKAATLGGVILLAVVVAAAVVLMKKKSTPLAAEITDSKNAVMVLVPEGDFVMGSDNGDEDERPVHTVYLDEFYIDKYEVTNSDYRVCVVDGVCKPPQDMTNYNNPEYENHPVVYVDWEMARTYCDWRDAQLPTEAQWEKAARGMDARTYPWGEGIACSQANYLSCIEDTQPFDSYAGSLSPYGAYNMAGNVWEWVADWYSPAYDVSETDNPVGAESGERRVLRGGGWNQHEYLLRTSARLGVVPTDVFLSFGFRCASDVNQ